MKTSKAWSLEHEDWVADLLGGRRTPASGAAINDKGDVITTELLVECKYTEKESRSIKKDEWEKINQEAHLRSKIPAMAFRFRKDNKKLDLIVLSIHDYEELVQELWELRERGGDLA